MYIDLVLTQLTTEQIRRCVRRRLFSIAYMHAHGGGAPPHGGGAPPYELGVTSFKSASTLSQRDTLSEQYDMRLLLGRVVLLLALFSAWGVAQQRSGDGRVILNLGYIASYSGSFISSGKRALNTCTLCSQWSVGGHARHTSDGSVAP